MRLGQAFGTWGGGTDVALPIHYAIERHLEVDGIVIVTDHETWYGHEHPIAAFERYRQQLNPRARLALLATAANQGSLVPDDDPACFGASGFDAAVPELLGEFLRA